MTMTTDTERATGLRERKKQRTRRSIEDAALELIAEHGYDNTTVEEIAERAEVSTTTFFRYFTNKAEVLLAPQTDRLPQLAEAILACPVELSDLEAIRRGVQAAWVEDVDAERMALIARATAASQDLQGMRNVTGSEWFLTTSRALATRRGLARPDGSVVLGAQVGLLVFASTLADWVAHGCRTSLGAAVDRGFALMGEVASAWATSTGQNRP